MKRYQFTDFIDQPRREHWLHDNEKIELVFEDGVIKEVWYRQAVLSSYVWEMAHHLPFDFTIHSDMLIDYPITMKTMQKLIERYMQDEDIIAQMEAHQDGPRQIWDEIMLVYNRLYNDGKLYTTAYPSPNNATELIDVVHHPVMEKVHNNLRPSHASQRKAYADADKFLLDSFNYELQNNSFIRDYRRGVANSKQFLTATVARYYISDIDNHQFRQPMLTSYARGNHNILWSAQESRDASIAELQATEPVAKSDYLNRRLQIIAEPISKIFPGDCGTKELIPWYVGERDLEPLIGVYHLDKQDEARPKLRPITKEDKHLIGQTIQIRSAGACHKLHEYGVCEVCMGKITNQIPKEFALGHISVQGALSDFVQLSLSAKHLIVSREAVSFVLDHDTAQFLKFPRQDDKNSLVIVPSILNNKDTVEFIFNIRDLKFIGDLANGIRAEDIQIATATFIRECRASITNSKGDTIRKVMKVSDMGRESHFSREFLEYVVQNQDMVTPIGRSSVKINLEKWNKKGVIFDIPLKITGVKDFMSNFENTVKVGSVKYGINGQYSVGISDMMRLCYNIVRECVYISVAHLGMMVASLLIRDKQALDYRPPLPNGKREFDNMSNIYAYRSLSQTMAYEKRLIYLLSPSITLVERRPNHPFDALYFPESADIYADVKHAIEYNRIPHIDKYTDAKWTDKSK